MSARNDGGQAFPQAPSHFDSGMLCTATDGMTLRDYFAAKAMVGIVQALSQGIRSHDVPKLAADAYFLADAMLKERVK